MGALKAIKGKSPPAGDVAKGMGIRVPYRTTDGGPFGSVGVSHKGHTVHVPGAHPWFHSDPKTGENTVNLPKGTGEAAVGHEFGHLKNEQIRRTKSKTFQRRARHTLEGSRMGMIPGALAGSAVAGGQADPSYKPGLAQLAVSAPTLLEEGRASAHAARYMVKRHGLARGAMRSLPLVPAFASYATLGAMPLGITAFRKHRLKKKEKVHAG
jgi:hypothetical protein